REFRSVEGLHPPEYSTPTKKEYCRLTLSANVCVLNIGRYTAVFRPQASNCRGPRPLPVPVSYLVVSTAARYRSSDSTSAGSATRFAISLRKSFRYLLRSR